MRGTPYNNRNNGFYGDMAAWLLENSEDNEADVRRLKRNLRVAMEEELTARQRRIVYMRFFEEKNVSEIADELGLDNSTVSRTLSRGLARIKKVLKYSL